jgi:hypothetical protein
MQKDTQRLTTHDDTGQHVHIQPETNYQKWLIRSSFLLTFGSPEWYKR